MKITINFVVKQDDFEGLMENDRTAVCWSACGLRRKLDKAGNRYYEVQEDEFAAETAGKVYRVTRTKFERAIGAIFRGDVEPVDGDRYRCSDALSSYVLRGCCGSVDTCDVYQIVQVACFGEVRYA